MKVSIGSIPTSGVRLELATLEPGEGYEISADDRERCVVLVGGRCSVDLPDAGFHHTGLGERRDVFDGPATAFYAPRGRRCRITAEHGGVRLAIVSAPARRDHPAYLVSPDALHVEHRGRGTWMRTVYDILGPDQPADRLLVGETFSREGVWSGYPPHRHEREDPPREHGMDEVFLVRIRPETGLGVLLHYPTGATRESATVVHDGDLVVLTEGYHSFVAAAEHDFYYLWALAGDHRALAMRVDPRHHWILERPSAEEAPR